MKITLLTLAIGFALSGGVSLGAAKKIVVNVNGMVCSMCAQGIPKALNSEPAIESHSISKDWKTVEIVLKDGKELSDKTIQDLIKDAGVHVAKITRE